MRKQWLMLLVLAGTGCVLSAPPLRAQMSEEEKKRLFLQSREDIRPVPKPSTTPRPKPQPASTPKSTPKPAPKPAAEDEEPPAKPKPTPKPVAEDEEPPAKPKPAPKPAAEDEEPPAKPKPAPKPAAEDEEPPAKPKPAPRPAAEDEEPPAKPSDSSKPGASQDFILLPGDEGTKKSTPAPGSAATPKAAPASKPAPEEEPSSSPVQIPQGKTPDGHSLSAPILVEKSGLEEDQGEEPPPKPAFGGLFKRYRYLTPSVRRAIDNARVKKGRWKYIIIHNSGTRQGNARIFDVYHRRVRKMQNGLAYHFVIGNGNSSGNGEIEIGDRWRRQINGGHVASDYLNNIALGICLVGDLNRDKPTPEQLAAIDELVTYLRGRVGKIKGKQAIVKGHKEINPKPTDCPGDRFPLGWLHQKFK